MYSGHAMAEIAGNEFSIRAANQEVRGCVAALEWK